VTGEPCLRLCEWGRADAGRLTAEQRAAVAEAANAWREAHRLSHAPLAFSGPRGETLTARQWVGVVEAGGVRVEVYPKLDARLLDAETLADGEGAGGVLSDLLWLMEVAREETPVAADTAGLDETPLEFVEVFALLLARNLRAELTRGPARRYVAREDDLKTVRGRIDLRQQATRHWGRMDKIACRWDEFTPDVALNQVLRCACRVLRERVSGVGTRRLLTDCVEMLDDVEDVPVPVALNAARNPRPFDRGTERFRLPYHLAVRLLSATGHALRTASAETYVFLTDMNVLFERFAHAVLEARFGVPVQTQQPVWYLLPELARGRVAQKPDFYWRHGGQVWIGDAKYKHLTRGRNRPLTFDALPDPDDPALPAGRVLSPDDVRQLTVYAELDRRKRGETPGSEPPAPASLALLYPYVGTGEAVTDETNAWNGSQIHLVPLRVTRVAGRANLAAYYPRAGGDSATPAPKG
jgi:5-methylcytosine-specific restriction enzyme subunit McrC